MKAFRDIRVIPVVVVAIAGFAVLKIAGLVIDGGYVFDYNPNATKPSWAQDQLNFPSGRRDFNDITGSVEKKEEGKKEEGKKDEAKKDDKAKEEAPKPAAPAAEAVKPPDGTVLYPQQGAPVSESERAVLERLQARRQELEARAREIDIRESLLKAAEKKVEQRVEELKATEARKIGRA